MISGSLGRPPGQLLSVFSTKAGMERNGMEREGGFLVYKEAPGFRPCPRLEWNIME
jgi:hypothetical protein